MVQSNSININEEDRTIILNAAKNGDIGIIQKYETTTLQSIKDGSGCTILHWACGNNHLPLLHHLLSPQNQTQIFQVDTAVKSRKAKGRTPLHYACRNGHLEIVQTLVEQYKANAHARAKHGVTPFQLAIWQNRLEVCQYLTDKGGIVPRNEVNDFGCGIIHWMGIAPTQRAEGGGLVPLAQWIFSQQGIDINMRQSQGRTVLHKASWGGHFDLVRYLHEEHGMYDDVKDHAGNYAADLCDMANTERHDVIAKYLRKECSLEYRHSCNVLGLDRTKLSLLEKDVGREEIRRAYLFKAKECHPDKRGTDNDDEFQSVKKAYEHLMAGGAAIQQKNPMHSIHLMLEVQKNKDIMNANPNESTKEIGSEPVDADDEMKLFKPRLIAVLLEYGQKGISLSNIPKVWDKVWPQNPFPSETTSTSMQAQDATETTNNEEKCKRKRKKGQLLRLIQDHAGDVVNVIRQKEKGILITPKNISHKDVTQFVSEQVEKLEIT